MSRPRTERLAMENLYEPLQPPAPLREQVYAALEELILDGRLQPGQRLVETELASQLGVSRGPVREALQMLARDGWLDVRRRQGTYVRELRTEELEDYFGVRTLLEVEAARLAARRVRKGDATAEELGELRALLDRSAEIAAHLAARDDGGAPGSEGQRELLELRREYRDTSRRFHYTLARVSGSVAMVELLEYLGKRTRWYFSSAPLERREARRGEHEELLACIEQGDEKRATALMRSHMEVLRSLSLEALRET
jgi:DNA-binding GntR family transcriptional regulator